jgi:CDP-glucose 4,6-dehydratase
MKSSFSEKLYKNFKDKRILVTGHTGFKGAWMVQILLNLECKILGVSKKIETKPSLFNILNHKKKINHKIIDLAENYNLAKKTIVKFNPQIIFHFAAQSLVLTGYNDQYKTFKNNILSTLNILEISKEIKSLKSFVHISSDKVYSQKKITNKSETDELDAIDPYSLSKVNCEKIFKSYKNHYFLKKNIGAVSLRAGNVIGGGDWSKDRLIPDFIKSLNKKKILLRNPNSIRPWQHVLDCLFGYLLISLKLQNEPNKTSGYWNIGPKKSNINVYKIVLLAKKKFKSKVNILRIKNKLKETKYLLLNSRKIRKELGYYPLLTPIKTIDFTINWYQSFFNNKKQLIELTNNQINYFLKKLNYK